jgi:dihydropteroate synthase
VDTSKSEVAAAAAEAGAEIVNDVTALRADSLLAEVARRRKLLMVLMHMRGEPRTMQKVAFARDMVRDVTAGLRRAVALGRPAGLAKSQIILDPDLGVGKSWAQNFELLARLPELSRRGYPLLAGPSRKDFVPWALGGTSKEARAWGAAAIEAAAILGGVLIVRVHDVAETARVARVTGVVANPVLRPVGPPSQ